MGDRCLSCPKYLRSKESGHIKCLFNLLKYRYIGSFLQIIIKCVQPIIHFLLFIQKRGGGQGNLKYFEALESFLQEERRTREQV